VEQSFINDYSVQAFYKVFSFGVFIESNEFLKKIVLKRLGKVIVYIMCLLVLSEKCWGRGSKKVR
jgi:hypothetical protein